MSIDIHKHTDPEKNSPTSPAIEDVWSFIDERSTISRQHNKETGVTTYNHDLHTRSENVFKTVKDFAFTRVELPAVYDIAATYGIFEAAQNREEMRHKNAITAIRHYNHPKLYPDSYSELDREHYAAMTSDFLLVNSLLDREYEKYREESSLSKFHDQISQSKPSFPLIDIRRIVKLVSEDAERYPDCEGVNIESILVQASAILDTIRKLYESDSPDLQELSKAVYNIEAFYAPVCEIIGYDALSMALRDYTMRIRVLQSDPIEITQPDNTKLFLTGAERIAKAEAAIDALGSPEDIENTITDAIQGIYGENVSITSIGNTTEHNIRFGVGTIEVKDYNDSTKDVKFRWRVKSIGSLASKYEKYASPLDLIGIIVIPGEEPTEGQSPQDKQQEAEVDVAVLFNKLVTNSTEHEDFTPTHTPDRERPFFVEGSKEYIDIMNSASGDYDIDMKKRKNGWQVAKGTLRYQDRRGENIPMEIMVQTLHDRRVARIGRASHPIYKTISYKEASREADVPEDLLDDLLHLATRKHSVNEGPTPQSAERAARILREIDGSPPPPHVGSRAIVAAGINKP